MSAAVRHPSVPGMFRGEVLKVSRQVSVWLLLAAAFVLLGVVVLASSTAPIFQSDLRRDPSAFVNDVIQIYGTVFQVGSGIFLLIVATRLFAMEYSSGVVRILYARGAGRLQLLLVKVAAALALGLLLLAGYLLAVTVIAFASVQAWSGSTSPLAHVSATEWVDVERAIAFYAANLVVLVVIAAAAAAVGRSLSFALPAALALFPADNFGSVILMLVGRVTGHQHPWLDINQWFLGPNLSDVVPLWLTTHPRPAFAVPTVTVDLTHVVVVIAAWTAGLAVVAILRTVRPDVLE